MLLHRLQWQDACYDVTWSEAADNVLVVATGNGSVVLWDTLQPQVRSLQLQLTVAQKISLFQECLLQGHSAEVSSVQWNLSRQHDHVISASWDHSIRLVYVKRPCGWECIGSFL